MQNAKWLLTCLILAGCSGQGGAPTTPGALNATTASGFGPPTQAEIEESIKRNFTDTYAQDYGFAKLDTCTIDVGQATIGNSTQAQVNWGVDGQQTYPVKVHVHIKVTYSNNPSGREVDRGDAEDDYFFFYKDAFGRWTFKTGSL